MSSVALQDRNGKSSGSIDLDQNIFGIEPNVAVMHQVVTAQLAARRSGAQKLVLKFVEEELSHGGKREQVERDMDQSDLQYGVVAVSL